MGYKEEDFKNAIKRQNYFFESCKTNEFGNVENVYGAVRIGNILRQVRWNSLGHCFDRRNNKMFRYNLKLSKNE